MAVTAGEARTLGEQHAGTESDAPVDSTDGAISQIAEWVPAAYRQAYLDAAAMVLRSRSPLEA